MSKLLVFLIVLCSVVSHVFSTPVYEREALESLAKRAHRNPADIFNQLMLNFLASILPPDAQGKRNLVNIRDTLGMERSSERRESNAYPYNFRREQVSKDHSMRDFNTYPWNNFKRRDSLGLERSNERQVSKAFPWYNFKRGQVAIDNNERFPILQELRERARRASRVSDRMHLPLAN